jgi:hypothetical protein
LNEPTTLPEGTEVALAIIEDELDDTDRARLHAELDAAARSGMRWEAAALRSDSCFALSRTVR